MQANNLSDALAASIGGTSGKGNRMDQYYDTGFELGGPIVKNRLWAWGADRQDARRPDHARRRPHDRTELQDYVVQRHRPDHQATSAPTTRSSAATSRSSAGAPARRVADEATYNQTGPTTLAQG